MIINRKLRRDVLILEGVEKVRWFETIQSGHILCDIPTYIETEITNQEDLDNIESEYEYSLVKTMLPQKPVL